MAIDATIFDADAIRLPRCRQPTLFAAIDADAAASMPLILPLAISFAAALRRCQSRCRHASATRFAAFLMLHAVTRHCCCHADAAMLRYAIDAFAAFATMPPPLR